MWQPTASIDALRQRAAIIASIRAFFDSRNVLEVETPCLSSHTISDPYLQAMVTKHTEPGASQSRTLYLQTSPEYAMKRLLAAGSGDIFQLCKAFRDDEVGRLHNPEFTMLEWYRVGFDMHSLINEVGALLIEILPIINIDQFTYVEVFQRLLGFDPLNISMNELRNVCDSCDLSNYAESLKASIYDIHSDNGQRLLKDSLLQVLFNQQIEPNIGVTSPAIVTNFPASQASLATLSSDGETANRFEVYFKGVELANGFNELTNVKEQTVRFEEDNAKRALLGLPAQVIDRYFLAALRAGLPNCSGVALGVDRLIMLATEQTSIEKVMSFSHRNC